MEYNYIESAMAQTVWCIGWLFTIGFCRLRFWQGVWAIIVWPYYIGRKYAPKTPAPLA